MSAFFTLNKQKLQIGIVVFTAILIVFAVVGLNGLGSSDQVATDLTASTQSIETADADGPATTEEPNDESNQPAAPEVAEDDPLSTTTVVESTDDATRSTIPATTDTPNNASSAGSSRSANTPAETTANIATSSSPTTANSTANNDNNNGSSSSTSGDSNAVWSEEFNSLDTSRWKLEDNSNFGVNEEQCYFARNVSVRDGKLVLVGKNENVTCKDGPRTQTSGMIRGQDFSFSPGQAIEFRVKLTPADQNNQAGLFPAVWSSGWAGSWPLGGEFDFLEVMTANNPTRPFFSMHYQDPSGQHVVNNKFFKLGENFTNDWHTVRVEYRTGDLRWFINGNLAHTVNQANTAQGWPAPFDRTIRDLRINLALGGRPGPLDPRALGSQGATFEMDYIRVFNL